MSTIISRDIVAHDLRSALHGKLDPAKLDEACRKICATSTSYSANGSVASFIFYLQFQVNITTSGGKSFNGKAGGASTPGGGALYGDVYTDNLDLLYRATHSFQFTGTPVYFSLVFFDGSSNVLGTFQSGAVSIVSGIGGGTGSWS
ncbi:virulence-associated protein [Nannocystis exedens]|uniref:Virulence-associated protein n=1 Tax=Nannocystis exedens TaxID=54 RepID=A0A1I2H3Z0_9BACT|nr:VapA/VapB family virulence-associated protein [Nannocystis exedens]PCC73992.1 virulence associated protein VapA [Nannocystis exedens]SFF24855.1 virulence-associated protein [Nannocystis exedens]